MTATVSPGMATTRSGAALPLVALPQGELLTVNIDQIPLLKDMVAPGIHIQTLRLDPERGEWVILATLAPGCELPLHFHTGAAQVYTLKGRWLYREYPDQPQTAGSYLYEPGGSVHTFYTPEDNTEDSITIAWIEGAQCRIAAALAEAKGADIDDARVHLPQRFVVEPEALHRLRPHVVDQCVGRLRQL